MARGTLEEGLRTNHRFLPSPDTVAIGDEPGVA
jgi:hypothetical protein